MRQFFAKSISSANRFFPRISPLDAAVVIYQLDVEIAHEAWRKTVIFKIFFFNYESEMYTLSEDTIFKTRAHSSSKRSLMPKLC